MKRATLAFSVGAVCLAGLGVVMNITNPDLADYQTYATETLTHYSQIELCPQVKSVAKSLTGVSCRKLVSAAPRMVGQWILKNTQRQDFVLFSLYTTDLSVSPLLPSYRFETLAVFQDFYTYRNEQYVGIYE
jgi:hypothetical protein